MTRTIDFLIEMGPWILWALLVVAIALIGSAVVRSVQGGSSGALYSEGFALLVAAVTGLAGLQGGDLVLRSASGEIDPPPASVEKRCRIELTGHASVPDGYALVISSRGTKDDHSYFESRISHVTSGDRDDGWKGGLTITAPGSYTLYLLAVPDDLAGYLATTNTVGHPDNTWWSSTGDLPPGSRTLDTVTIRHVAGATGRDCPKAT